MSEKAVVKFLKSLDENEALKKEFVTKMPKTTDPAGVVAFASKRGFDFTADELEKYAASFATTPRKALSDKDLSDIVGGVTFPTGTIYGSVSTQILRDTYYSGVVANRLM
jgi:predicted ribosomally synthesized peptide with nif11-like leader